MRKNKTFDGGLGKGFSSYNNIDEVSKGSASGSAVNMKKVLTSLSLMGNPSN